MGLTLSHLVTLSTIHYPLYTEHYTEVNTMTSEELKVLEKQAFYGSIELDKLNAPEYRYLDRLRRLYHEFRFGNMPLEHAERMKQVAYKEYLCDIEEAEYRRKIFAKYQENIKAAGMVRIRAVKAETMSEALFALAEGLALLLDDNLFVKTLKERWKNE